MANLKAKAVDVPNEDGLDDLTFVKEEVAEEKTKSNRTIEAEKGQEIKKKTALKGMKKLLDMCMKVSSHCDQKLNTSLHNTEEGRLKAMMDSTKATSKESILKELNLFHGNLHDYQVDGVLWLKTLFEHGVNGILADEMGLGKTVQIIALLCHLLEQEIKGPFLIVVPLSTLPNWSAEFKRFAPSIPVVIFRGDQDERHKLSYDILKVYDMNGKKVRPVVLTTIQMVNKELNILKRIVWKYLIVDEAHSLKNHKSRVSMEMRQLQCVNKVLLTGTPLQNDLTELWSLLNFIMPLMFKNNTFSSLLNLEDLKNDNKIVQEEVSNNVISSIHKVLAPFMLRRLKTEVLGNLVPKKEVLVYCPLTKLQRELYTCVLEKNIAALQGIKEVEEVDLEQPRKRRKCTIDVSYEDWEMSNYRDAEEAAPAVENTSVSHLSKQPFTHTDPNQQFIAKITMCNPMMLFKKIVNHPYLVHIPVTPDGKDVIIDERVLSESGKMLVLDAMLKKLKKGNHKVLIFSTLCMMLDLIEEYVIMKDYKFCRLDGSTSLEGRQVQIDNYNNNSDIFLFLISTRAGGLGINLTAADTVILFDRDWNPQVDLQAQDRCHRIGQTRPVMIFSLITKNTIDQRIVELAGVKRRLEKLVIKNGKSTFGGNKSAELYELQEMLKAVRSTDAISANGKIYSDQELEQLLDRSELYQQMDAKESNKENSKNNK